MGQMLRTDQPDAPDFTADDSVTKMSGECRPDLGSNPLSAICSLGGLSQVT